MSASALSQLLASTVVYVLAAAAAKQWAIAPGTWKLVLTLALYTLGNLIIMRLIRGVGMSMAFSLSAVVQLAAVNLLAFAVFGEKVNVVQGGGIVLAVVAVALITLGPYVAGSR